MRDTALCPLARWLRWQLVAPSAGSYEATFRIWIAANAPGGFARSAAVHADMMEGSAGAPAYTGGTGSGQINDQIGATGRITGIDRVPFQKQIGPTGHIQGVHAPVPQIGATGHIGGVKQWKPGNWRDVWWKHQPPPPGTITTVTPEQKVTTKLPKV